MTRHMRRLWVVSVGVLLLGAGFLVVAHGSAGAAENVLSTAPPPTLTRLEPPALPIAPGGTATLTATMSAVQAADAIIVLQSSDPDIAAVPATVTVPAASVAVPIPVAALSSGVATITATLNGSRLQSVVTIRSTGPMLTALLPSALQIVPGASGTLTLTLNAVQPTDTPVLLTSSAPGIVGLPAAGAVSVPAGTLTTAITLTGLAPGTSTITATLPGSSAQSQVTVTVLPPALGSLLPPILALTEGSTGTLTVTLNATQPVATEVGLSTSDPMVVGLPADRVTVPAGALTSRITVTGLTRGLATVTASLHGKSGTAAIAVVPPPPTVQTLTCPATVTAQATALCAVTLNAAQLVPTTVPLASSDPGILTAPESVTIPADALTVGVPVAVGSVGSATLTVGPLHGTTRTASLQVLPPPPTIASLTPATVSLLPGATTSLTLTLNAAQLDDLVIPLAVQNSEVLTAPAMVTVPAGTVAVPVPVVAFTPGTTTLTAGPLNGTQDQSTLQVTSLPPAISQIDPASLTLPKGAVGTLTLTITPTQTDATAVALASSEPVLVEVPASVTVPSGANSAAIPVLARDSGTAVVTAGPLNGTSRQASVTVTPPALVSLTVAPAAATIVIGQTQQFTATGTLTDGTTQGLNGAVTWSSSTDTVASITSPGGLATALAPGTALITATHADGFVASAQLSVVATGSTPGGTSPAGTTAAPGSPPGSGSGASPSASPAEPSIGSGSNRALAGRVVDTERRPIAGVTIVMPLGSRELRAVTDEKGRFHLAEPPAGDQLVLIDGETASTASAKYPTIPVTVRIRQSGTTQLHYVPHLHRQKDRNFTPIALGQETVATDPELPGVKLRIPAGAQIIGWDGQPNTKVSIRTVPIDRLPVPPVPAEVRARTVYMFYFGKRGGGVASRPIPFESPNDLRLKPGEKADLWYFDESPIPGVGPNAWRKAGTGTVSPNGKLIQSDPGMGIPRFCCGSSLWNPQRGDVQQPAPTPQPDQDTSGGDPVNLSTGIFMLTATDLVLPGRIPITLTRTYRSGDALPGQFGIGTTLGYDDYLEQTSSEIFTYVSRGNAKTVFSRQADGIYINTEVPYFRGARITVNADGTRTLRFKDGAALVFGASGMQIGVRDRAGNAITIERLYETNPSILRDPAGRTLTLNYVVLAKDRVTSVRDPLGRTVSYGYDAQNRLVSVTNPAGGITRYTYDDQHRMTSITDPRNITFLRNNYDVNSRVCQQQQADGGWFTFYYITADQATLPESLQLLAEAATGGPISMAPCTATASSAVVVATVLVDPRGKPTTYHFNSQGYLFQKTDALGQVTTYERQDGTNLLLSVTDPLNRVTRYQYDANGNVTQITPPVTDPPTLPRAFTYDPTFNRVTSSVDPLGNTTTFQYDSTGNLTAITDPEQNLRPEAERLKTRFAYNGLGQLISSTDPLDHTTSYTYSAEGDLESITDPLGRATHRGYDLVSRLVTQTDPLGRRTRFSYDALNRVTNIVDPLGGTTSFGYDANGNLLTVTDARGNITRHEYNPMDQLSRRIDPLNRAETFSYDGNGNLTITTDRKSQTTTFTYDPLNRRTRAEYADGTVATFTYDAGNRLTQADDTADPHRPITFTYDPLDRLLTETTGLGTVTYAYDNAGRRTTMTVSGQAPVSYTHDHNARLRTITQAPLNPVDIQYDAANRRTLLTLPNGVSTEYVYDLGSRLTALVYRNVLGPLGDLQYSYDAAGNRIHVGGSFARTLVPNAVTAATYDAANRQLAFGGSTMSFDDNGNLVTQTDPSGTITYTWDGRNRLTGMSGPSLNASFAYDGLGRRARKTIGGAATDFVYDGLDVVKETGGAGEASYLRTLAIDEALTRTEGTGTLSYLADVLGSTVALTDAVGNPPTTYTFAPFGDTTVSGTPSANPFQFTGREYDWTGVHYYRARYYDSKRGRFLSEDPFGILLENAYAYVNNNPVKLTDPLGLFPVSGQFCRYYERKCLEVGLECRRNYSQPSGRASAPTGSGPCRQDMVPEEVRPFDTGGIWQECVQKNPSCQSMVWWCGIDALLPFPSTPRRFP